MRNIHKLTACLVLFSSTAWAGELTGNDTLTPVGERAVSTSICAFSGLSDGDADMPDPFKVQTFGQLRRLLGYPAGVPGIACRGH